MEVVVMVVASEVKEASVGIEPLLLPLLLLWLLPLWLLMTVLLSVL